MRKILFLDVDGVLNCRTTKDTVQGCPGIDDKKMHLVRRIADRTGAEIVLTSTWKDQWRAYVRDGKEDPWGKRLAEALAKEGLVIAGTTADEMDDRGWGIRKWLRENGAETAAFAVLDDTEFSDFASQGILPHLVKTDYSRGLTWLDARRAVRILERKTGETKQRGKV